MNLTHIRDLTVDAMLPSGRAFLSAASGMVVRGSMLCVVADDAHCLAVFDLDGNAPGRLIPIIAGDLPQDAAQRKKVKPDFEILLALPSPKGTRLLALGSGSKPQRMRGAIIDLPENGAPATVRLIDLKPLFAALAPLVPEINLEGAVLRDDQLLLFNRGNMERPASQIVDVPLDAVLAGGPVRATLRAELHLPMVAGVPLTVTDACQLDDGRVLLSAVAEATADSYADGALLGAAIVELDGDFQLRSVQPLEPAIKAEGLSVRTGPDGVHLLCVTDADDPEQASGLWRAVHHHLRAFSGGT
ncbi:MAG: DUF6929 family protein [Novosphingobium sp.]